MAITRTMAMGCSKPNTKTSAVDGKAEQIVTHKELMRVMKVMEAAFESDAAGKPVEFNDTI